MDQLVLIMAQGKQERLPISTYGYKQLLRIGNESIIVRQIRLLREAGASDIRIVAEETRPWREVSKLLCVQLYPLRIPGDCILSGVSACLDRLAPSERRPILFMLGDVIFSRALMHSVLSDRGEIRIFARKGPNPATDKLDGEAFALRVSDAAKKPVAALSQSRSHASGSNGKLFDLAAALVISRLFGGEPIHPTQPTDWSDDVDCVEDLARLPVLEKLAVEDDAAFINARIA